MTRHFQVIFKKKRPAYKWYVSGICRCFLEQKTFSEAVVLRISYGSASASKEKTKCSKRLLKNNERYQEWGLRDTRSNRRHRDMNGSNTPPPFATNGGGPSDIIGTTQGSFRIQLISSKTGPITGLIRYRTGKRMWKTFFQIPVISSVGKWLSVFLGPMI